jgi:hypothetical protein
MRNIPKNIAQMLGSGAYFVYCFEIKNDDLAFYLTSGSKAVTIGDITYEPYSELKLVVLWRHLFEANGITRKFRFFISIKLIFVVK